MIVEEKKTLRKAFLAKRKELCRKERNEEILKQFLLSPFFERSSFFVYLSVGAEVETEQIIAALLAADKRVLLPRVEDGRMYAVPYSDRRERFYGIPQPAQGEDECAEVALTPLIAFDREGYRLGYGGGYYDGYFARRPQIVRVGLAYEGQAVGALPHEAHDMPLNAVITETGVRYFT